MKTILKNKNFYIIGFVFLLLLFQWNAYNSKTEALINTYKEEIRQEQNKKSPEEILFQKAKEYSDIADRNLDNINSLKDTITSIEQTYEENILKKRCYQDQIKRLSEKLDIEEGFCENLENLEQFKKKQ